MARTTYLAPGVYVEEVPSAQQPIAGVGTNTVGFIGIVPDEIQYPVPNPDYDPVLAQLVLTVAELTAAGKEVAEGSIADIEREITRKERENKNLEEQIAEHNRRLEAAKGDLESVEKEIRDLEAKPKADRTPEEKTKLGQDKATQERLGREIAALDAEIRDKTGKVDRNKAAIETARAAKEGKAAPAKPAGESALQPYLLETFMVTADACDTKLCTNFTEYTKRFGPFSAYSSEPGKEGEALSPGHKNLTHAVYGFFNNGGTRCFVARARPDNPGDIDRALRAFESIDEVAIIAAPGLDASPEMWDKLVTHCENSEDRFAILDSAAEVEDEEGELDIEKLSYTNLDSLLPRTNKNAAFYFPHIEVLDTAKQIQDIDPVRKVPTKYRGRTHVPPSGHIAGIYARTDEERGVHKAPANCAILGALNVKYYISKPKQELLNPQGVNCIRNMNGNILVWGARTIGGDKNGEWKYVSVRRLFLFIRESIDEGTQWVVFEPNDRALWGKIRRNVSDFLTNVWRSGALFGSTPEEAFYVKCDDETNPPEVRELGQVVTEIGVAIVRPAEFVIFRISQAAGRPAG